MHRSASSSTLALCTAVTPSTAITPSSGTACTADSVNTANTISSANTVSKTNTVNNINTADTTANALRAANLRYTGRFAPSPSGHLHFGSLVCALASYLDARANNGRWLVRIEDIDPPREQRGASAAILTCLEHHHLFWDNEVVYQSRRSESYLETLQQLHNRSLSYRCDCTRKRLAALDGIYDGYCLSRRVASSTPSAVRLNIFRSLAEINDLANPVQFTDGIQGEQSENLLVRGDYVIHRKDRLFAYQLAVVVDDIWQDITHVVRGADLLDTTARQILLFRLLGRPAPKYSHLPVIVDAQGKKLSKQNRAPAIDNAKAGENLYLALRVLGLNPDTELNGAPPLHLVEWAVKQWHLGNVVKKLSIIAPESDNNLVKAPINS